MTEYRLAAPDLGDAIGHARYQRYLLDAKGDPALAFQLYDWNRRASTAFFSLVSDFELLLRNAIDIQLRKWNEATFSPNTTRLVDPCRSVVDPGDWTLNTSPIIWRALRGDRRDSVLRGTYRRATLDLNRSSRLRASNEVDHDDMVAHLTFGNWVYLLPARKNQDRRTLWHQAVSKAFPRWDPAEWEHLTRRVGYAHLLRNRISHLEPITHYNLRQTRRGMKKVVSAMGAAQYQFFKNADQTGPVLDSFPIDSWEITWRDVRR